MEGIRHTHTTHTQHTVHAVDHMLQDLTRGEANDFFRKMSPVCELTLGSQGPFSTGVKLNTTQPCWDDSIEFDAAAAVASLLLSPSRPSKVDASVVGCEGLFVHRRWGGYAWIGCSFSDFVNFVVTDIHNLRSP